MADLVDLRNQHPLLHFEQLRAVLYIDRTGDCVGYERDALHHVGDQSRPPDGIITHLLEKKLRFKTNEIDLILRDETVEILGILLLGKGVGILSVGQQHHLHIHAILQQQVDTPQGCFDTGRISVVEHRDVLREAVDHPYLSVGEGCPRRGDYILYACLMHGEHIGIPFHQEAFILFYDRTLGEVEPIELLTLGVNLTFG